MITVKDAIKSETCSFIYILFKIVKVILLNMFFACLCGLFLWIGFATIRVELVRDVDGSISGKISNTHLWGLVKTVKIVNAVKGADIQYDEHPTLGEASTHKVVLLTAGQNLPVSSYSNFDYQAKEELKNKINNFINSKSLSRFSQISNWDNIFGWAAIMVFFVWILYVFDIKQIKIGKITITNGWKDSKGRKAL